MAERAPVKLGVLISGTGTNLQAIIDALQRGDLHAEIRLVISNRADAQGLERAHRHGISTRVIEHRRFPSREDFDRALVDALTEHGVELVVCAGFMRLLSPVMLAAFPDRVMNIHPALLPAFPGVHAQKAALEYGVRFTGCTVFFVREGVDDGPIIVQAVVPVMPGDDEESLSERILRRSIASIPGRFSFSRRAASTIEGRTVRIADFPAGDESLALVNPRSPHSPRLKRPH